jgi:hypothetical protein
VEELEVAEVVEAVGAETTLEAAVVVGVDTRRKAAMKSSI